MNMTYIFYVTQLIDSYKSFWNDSYDPFTSFTVCHSCLEGVLISPVEEIPQEEVTTNSGHRRYPTDQNRGAMARNQKKQFLYMFICLYMIKAYQTLSLSQSCLIHLMISI